MLKKRATILLFSFLVIFSLGITSFIYIQTSPRRDFKKITNKLLVQNLEDNSLLAHFLISDPQKA